MKAETENIERYLQETLGIQAQLSVWTQSDRLPLYLRDGYQFYETILLKTRCLFLVDRADNAPSPAAVSRQLDQVQPKWEGEIVYVRNQVASHQRKRLIEQRVPFLVPGNQLYLPMLGIDLREHFRKQRQSPSTLKPATQTVVLEILLHRDDKLQTPVDFAQRLGYSKMTMSRAFDEIESEQLCVVFREGRERRLRLKGSRRELWEAALPLLRTPVRTCRTIRWNGAEPVGPVAGLEALASRTMLAASEHPVFAISADDWKREHLRWSGSPIENHEPGSATVEIWTYDPKLFSDGEVVDPFSLFLSLQDNNDDRVLSALKHLMEGLQWYGPFVF